MTQTEFSSMAESHIAINHTAFLEIIKYNDDGSFECEIRSPHNRLILWISTYNQEITIGFDNIEGTDGYHTHMSLFGANFPNEELKAMSELLDSIFLSKHLIVHSSISGFTLTDDVQEELKMQTEGEVIEVYKWSDC